MCGRFKIILLFLLVLSFNLPAAGMAARIKDISSIKGIRPNQLFGYGLVIGLFGSGDKGGSSFTQKGLANMLEHMGINVNPEDIKAKNVAAVIVSATYPPFARIGKKIDVTLSSIGDAKSLLGGTLLLTPLKGVDSKVYALAQGPVVIGGYAVGGAAGGGVGKNHTTVGRISGGATIEREIPLSIMDKKEMTIILNNPDFNTAARAAQAINSQIGEGIARAIDPGTLSLNIPEKFQDKVVKLIAQIGDLEVVPDCVAKVIVNEKTGTVVVGENVRIQKVAVAHGNLSIQIKETKQVSQPLPFAPPGRGTGATQMEGGTIVAPGGSTVVTPDSDVGVTEEDNRLVLIPEGRTIGELVKALNAIGVTPRDLITILQAIKAAGALQGDLQII
ncbi:MAG: flagellar basal body P-ring protein FlgI [Deltaproteobacteria bacterium]|nr:flagellar basal body P-ring protein FlgI [Deltaproteobacteria bacterium]